MNRVLVSTGTFIGRVNGRNFRLIPQIAKDIECDGYEFMTLDSWYEPDSFPEIERVLKESGLSFPTLHCDKEIGQFISIGGAENLKTACSKFEINVRLAEKIGADRLILHLWSGEPSDQNFENNILGYRRLREIADHYGRDLLIENVLCNKLNPMRRWCDLYEVFPDVHFIFDTKMADFHGELDLLYDKEYDWLWKEDHIKHYHVNDHAGSVMDWSNLKVLPIGKGHIDFDRFFDFVKKTGYKGDFTLESTVMAPGWSVDTEALNEQVRLMKRVFPGKD